MNRKLRVLIFFVAVGLFTTGCIDMDWMIVENHFQMWNATKDTWEFCPYLTMNWWLAYIFTLARIVVGAVLLGIVVKWLWDEQK